MPSPKRKSKEAEGGVAAAPEEPFDEIILEDPGDGKCPLCGDAERHRHCTNCEDKLDVSDERGHMMQSGIFSCSPKDGADEGVHVAI